MRAAIAMLMACALAFAPATATADEHADDRSYEVTVSDDRAEIQMPREVEDRSGTTSVVLDTEEGLLRGGFGFAEADDGQQLDVRLHQLVEYADKNGNGHLDDGDDTASAWKIANASENVTADSNGTLSRRAIEQHDVTSEDGVEGTTIQAVAEFPDQDPIEGVISELGQAENRTLTINLTVFEDATTYDGTEVPGNHVHVDWTLDNYPYTREETKMALVADADGTDEVTLALDEDEPRIGSQAELEGFGVGLTADVAGEALVDGNETEVAFADVNASEDADVERPLSMNYDTGDAIEHELVLGASVDPVDTGTIDSASDQISEVPAPDALAAVGLLATAAVAVTRR